jgi:hypothetical protein
MNEASTDELRWLARIKELEWRAELARLVLAGDTAALSERLAQGPGAVPGDPQLQRELAELYGCFPSFGESHDARCYTSCSAVACDECGELGAHWNHAAFNRDRHDYTSGTKQTDDAFLGYLDELERLCNAATPGPWTLDEDEPWRLVAPDGQDVVGAYGFRKAGSQQANARFVAAASHALPTLIAKARELQAELDEAHRRLRFETTKDHSERQELEHELFGGEHG